MQIFDGLVFVAPIFVVFVSFLLNFSLIVMVATARRRLSTTLHARLTSDAQRQQVRRTLSNVSWLMVSSMCHAYSELIMRKLAARPDGRLSDELLHLPRVLPGGDLADLLRFPRSGKLRRYKDILSFRDARRSDARCEPAAVRALLRFAVLVREKNRKPQEIRLRRVLLVFSSVVRRAAPAWLVERLSRSARRDSERERIQGTLSDVPALSPSAPS